MSLIWNFSYGGGSGKVSSNGKVWLFGYPCSSNSSCSYYSVELGEGTYLFELWGAQGGDARNGILFTGAVGGYTSAAITFEEAMQLQLFIGGTGGIYDDLAGGFNGGGKGTHYSTPINANKGAPGGGATDIKIQNLQSFQKILVAGGGGGASTWQKGYYGQDIASGVGGGTSGGNGAVCLGGGQSLVTDSSCTAGTEGKGADGGGGSGARGGGGYYGGSGGKSHGHSGGGGSGFISSMFSTTNGIKPITLKGTESFPKPSLLDSGNETGHEGNGAIRITFLSPFRSPTRSEIPKHIKELCDSICSVKKPSRERINHDFSWIIFLMS
jgi:hypothetical protein